VTRTARRPSRDRATATFVPYSIDVVGARSVVRWIERPDTPSPTPSFARVTRALLAAGARQRLTPIDALLAVEERDPAGLVLHQSRCGSTLLMQALAHAGCISAVNEATPVNQLLLRTDIPEPERVLLLRGLLRALSAHDGAASDLPSVVKFTSWNVLFLDLIRAAMPETPWLFLYRDPLEVLASHQAKPVSWSDDDGFLGSLSTTGQLPPLHSLVRERRCAALLAAYGRAALRAMPSASNLLNYDRLPVALSSDVPARFGVVTSADQQREIANASRIYSKDASRSVVFDAQAERRARPVSDAMREADKQFTRQVYESLERPRAVTFI